MREKKCSLSPSRRPSEEPERARGLFLWPSGRRKSLETFPTACKNAITFPPFSGGKVLAALAERLAMQGIQGIRSHSRRAAAPSSSPANTRADSSEQRFFDMLRRPPVLGGRLFFWRKNSEKTPLRPLESVRLPLANLPPFR